MRATNVSNGSNNDEKARLLAAGFIPFSARLRAVATRLVCMHQSFPNCNSSGGGDDDNNNNRSNCGHIANYQPTVRWAH
jgi:hypothetical protein